MFGIVWIVVSMVYNTVIFVFGMISGAVIYTVESVYQRLKR